MLWWLLIPGLFCIAFGLIGGWVGYEYGYRRGNDDGRAEGWDACYRQNIQARESFIETLHEASK